MVAVVVVVEVAAAAAARLEASAVLLLLLLLLLRMAECAPAAARRLWPRPRRVFPCPRSSPRCHLLRATGGWGRCSPTRRLLPVLWLCKAVEVVAQAAVVTLMTACACSNSSGACMRVARRALETSSQGWLL